MSTFKKKLIVVMIKRANSECKTGSVTSTKWDIFNDFGIPKSILA